MVTVENLSKTFGTDTEVLKDINLNIKKNEIVAILGPSGTGKSTLLRCLNFLCIPTTGIIQIGKARVDAARYTSKEVRNLRRQSAMVFQGYNLFKNKTALENVMEALVTVQNRPKAEAEETSLRLLEKVGMLDRKDFYPAKMSGGQQQRVAIARALAVNPDVLLFDEPTSALDPELVGEVLNTIRQLAEEYSTMVLVTHEIKFARNVATRILFMDNGMIAADGSPEELIDNPENPRLRQFLNFVRKYSQIYRPHCLWGHITFYSDSGRNHCPKYWFTPATRPSASVVSVAAEWSEALSPSSISTDGTVEKEVWVRSMAMEPPENILTPAPLSPATRLSPRALCCCQ